MRSVRLMMFFLPRTHRTVWSVLHALSQVTHPPASPDRRRAVAAKPMNKKYQPYAVKPGLDSIWVLATAHPSVQSAGRNSN